MPLRHHSLVAWQRADDLFIKLHQLTLQSFPAMSDSNWAGNCATPVLGPGEHR